MPVKVDAKIRQLDQNTFREIAYQVMNDVFAVHNKMGKLLDEAIYRNAIAARIGHNSQTEVRIEVRFRDFLKEYFMDLLVAHGAVFELKTVTSLMSAHRWQLLNDLLLCELSHGKLINLGRQRVEHEFVNTHLKHSDRTAFEVELHHWRDPVSANGSLREWVVAFLRDVGAGLDVHLYQSAVSHFFGGEDTVLQDVDVLQDGQCLGRQKLRLVAPNWAFKVTTIQNRDPSHFEDHSRRLLQHTHLEGLHWINVTKELVRFQSISKP